MIASRRTGPPSPKPVFPGEGLRIDRVAALGGMDLVRARFVSRRTPLHAHREFEVGLVIGGWRLLQCRGRTYLAPPGSLVALMPWEAHAGLPLDDSGSWYRSFLFSRASLELLPGWSPGVPATGPWFDSPVIKDPALADRFLRTHLAFDEVGSTRALDATLLDNVAELCDSHGRCSPGPSPSCTASRAVEAVRAYLDVHFAERVRLSALAEVGGVSVYYLIRIFRASTGLTPYAYLEQVRVHRATQLLREGLAVSMVACLTGFADQSHLTRLFKRLVGIPPGEYRRGVRRRFSTRASLS